MSRDGCAECKDPAARLEYHNGWTETHLGQIYRLQSKFPQTLTAVDVGLGRASDTTAAKLGADSILVCFSMNWLL